MALAAQFGPFVSYVDEVAVEAQDARIRVLALDCEQWARARVVRARECPSGWCLFSVSEVGALKSLSTYG